MGLFLKVTMYKDSKSVFHFRLHSLSIGKNCNLNQFHVNSLWL